MSIGIKSNRLPYDYRNNENVGKYQGTGIPAQVARKDGGFSDYQKKENRLPKDKPPRKMN